jgi:hypothetical protein
MPAVVRDDVLAVFANRIIMVGGPALFSNAVGNLASC